MLSPSNRFSTKISVHSRYGLHARQVAIATLYPECSNGFVTSAAAPIATGWNEPPPEWDFRPTVDQRLSRRTGKVEAST